MKNDRHILKEARRVLAAESKALAGASRSLGPSMAAAARLLARCRGKICVLGMGKSGSVARKVSGTLSSVGLPSFYMNPSEALHGDLGALGGGDLILAFSHSGRTREILAFLDALPKALKIIVAITGDARSALARRASCHVKATVPREACPLNLAPTASTAVAMGLGDALALAAADLKGFSQADFARRHPGGHLGERLSQKALRWARKGRKIGWLSPKAGLMEAARAISRHGIGAVLVRGRAGSLGGILVDGDLRRALAAGKKNALVGDLMSPRPVSLPDQATVSEALELMEKRTVHQVVLLRRAKVVGVLHIHDLLGRGRLSLG